MKSNIILEGNSLSVLKTLESESVHTCVTSPPYFGLRDYGMSNQIGLEETPDVYVQKLVEVFREVRRVLRDDGTLWLNLGDSYNAARDGGHAGGKKQASLDRHKGIQRSGANVRGLKPKDLIGIPWRVAFALQADGWYLRQDIIWHKPNPMPESVTDRCTKAHEYIFLFSKSKNYYFDSEAIMEPLSENSIKRVSQVNLRNQKGSARVPGKTNGNMKAVVRFGGNKAEGYGVRTKSGKEWNPKMAGGGTNLPGHSGDIKPDGTPFDYVLTGKRNKRSVWTVTTKPFKGAHFATFPPDLIEPCVLAGAPEGGIVLDPFFGSGTTGAVAVKNNRKYIGIELNPKYIELANHRLTNTQIKLL